MKRFFFIILAFFLILYAEEKALFKETVTSGASGSDYSSMLDLEDNVRNYGEFHGLLGLALNIDSLTDASITDTSSHDDSLLFFPQYRIAGEWVTGDTIQWYRVGLDTGWIDSTKWVIPETHHTWNLIWQSDPDVAGTIQAYPWQVMRVKRTAVTDTNNYAIELRVNSY